MATPYKSVLLGMFGLLVMLPMVAQEPISKKFAKSYDFSNDGEVNIENKYGKINLYGWDKDEISISLDITVDHKRKEDSEELLSRIKPVIRRTENYISISYKVEEESSSLFGQLFEKANPFDADRRAITVNYKVYLPQKAELDITNKFGDVFVEDWKGVLKAHVEHGDMWLNDHLNKVNIVMEYGEVKARDIQYADIDLKNGALDMQDSRNMHINSEGSEIEIHSVNSLEIHSSKDEINITEIGSIYGTLGFSNFQLKSLEQFADLNMKVAEFTLDNIKDAQAQLTFEQESSEISLNIIDFPHGFKAILEEGLVRLPKSFYGVKSNMLDKGKKLREINAQYGKDPSGSISISGRKGVVVLKEL